MPINSFVTQPGSASVPKIYAAYRPIIFIVAATAPLGSLGGVRTPPRVFCDIYFNGVFYKTLSATQYTYLDYTNTQWTFDISAAAQEYLSFNLPTNGGSIVETAPDVVVNTFCRFRSSSTNVDGFLVAEGSAPVQATGNRPATAGQGTQSESFQIINAVLQHEDVQDLQTHLQYSRPNAFYEANTFPLTHRPNGYKVCSGDSDHYPFVHLGNKQFAKITVVRTNKVGTTTTSNYSPSLTCSSVVSSVQAQVLETYQVNATFLSSGPARQWEWTIDGGTTWTSINSTTFTITWEDLLQILISEIGQDLITENGEIIIPEGVDPFKTYTLTVRPRCANAAYGTSGSTTYVITETPACPLPTLSYTSKNETAQTITFATVMPSPYTNVQLEWKFDYGNGIISSSSYEDRIPDNPFIWSAPARADTGTYKVRIRTKCGTDYYSPFTSWVDVPWAKAASTVTVYVGGAIYDTGNYIVTCRITEAVSDNVTVSGYFLGDAISGGRQTFTFHCVIPAGSLSAQATVGGAEEGGLANNFVISNASPDPTTNGKDLVYH